MCTYRYQDGFVTSDTPLQAPLLALASSFTFLFPFTLIVDEILRCLPRSLHTACEGVVQSSVQTKLLALPL